MVELCSNPTASLSRWRRAGVVVLSVAAAFAVGCADAQEEPAQAVPRVKIFEVGETTLGQVRTLSGEVAAGTTSPLSFGVSGTVDRVLVSRGASVAAGDLLASLDSAPLRLSFDQARAELASERAKLEEAEQAYERASSLLAGRGITQAEYERATSQVRSARASLRSAQSRAEQAERDLGRTELRAPFAGRIAERSLDAFQEIGANDAAFVLQGDAVLKVRLQVPDTLIRNVDYGKAAQVRFPTMADLTLVGIVTLIGAQAGAGSVYTVEVQLPESEADLRPGMTASVTFNFDQSSSEGPAYLLPLSAVAVYVGLLRTDPAPETVPVFVLDEASSKLEVRDIRVRELRGNRLEVYEGLSPGDKVVAAGVSFLREGMVVEVWQPELGLGDG
jgi:RND family efflux transporter MFP subunit